MLSTDIALYLAIEGVPIRAIARATHIPSSDLREQLLDAKQTGRLLELPRDDWPPGPRDQRPLQLSRLVVAHKDELVLAAARRFALTATEARLLLVLLQSPSLDKNRADMSTNCIGVHISRVRRQLRPFGVAIVTVSDFGYRLSAHDRRKAMGLILEHLARSP